MPKWNDEVREFAKLMLGEMQANDHKSDRYNFRTASPKELLGDCLLHAGKLAIALKEQDHIHVQEHTADVANIAMMILLAYEHQRNKQNEVSINHHAVDIGVPWEPSPSDSCWGSP